MQLQQDQLDNFRKRNAAVLASLRARHASFYTYVNELDDSNKDVMRKRFEKTLRLVSMAIAEQDRDILHLMDKFMLDIRKTSPYIIKVTATALEAAGHKQLLPVMTEEHIERSRRFDRAATAASSEGTIAYKMSSFGETNDELILLRAAALTGDQEVSDLVIERLAYLYGVMVERNVRKYSELMDMIDAVRSVPLSLSSGIL